MSYLETDYDKLNAFNMLKEQLVTQIKTELLDSILAEEVKRFENTIKPVLVEKITFDYIDSYQEAMSMRNEMRIIISTDGNQTTKTSPPKYLK